MASYLINSIPKIESKKYLELGVYMGATFNAVKADFKKSVDLVTPADYQMSTQEFFRLPSLPKFDIAYIDADHSVAAVVRDFNQVQKVLSRNSYLFVHDLFPQTEELTASWYCGDGYKFLAYIVESGLMNGNFLVLDGDYGLAVFRKLKKIDLPPSYLDMSYEQFLVVMRKLKRYSTAQIQNLLSLPYGALWS
jgi:hypothetical protein